MRILFAAACLPIAAVALLVTRSAPSDSAARLDPHAAAVPAQTRALAVTSWRGQQPGHDVRPAFHQDITLHIVCGHWKGELSWGGNGSILFPAFIRIEGDLTDRCHGGWARLELHYDTIDNPKNPTVKKVKGPGSARTPFYTEDHVNTYKDIYVYICSKDPSGKFRCSKHEGPGA